MCNVHGFQEGYGSETFIEVSDSLYDRLNNMVNLRNELVIDDRTNMTVGRRLLEADRQGYPYSIVVGRKVQ